MPERVLAWEQLNLENLPPLPILGVGQEAATAISIDELAQGDTTAAGAKPAVKTSLMQEMVEGEKAVAAVAEQQQQKKVRKRYEDDLESDEDIPDPALRPWNLDEAARLVKENKKIEEKLCEAAMAEFEVSYARRRASVAIIERGEHTISI